MTEELEQLKKQNEEIISQNKELLASNESLKKNIEELKAIHTEDIKSLANQFNTLKTEFTNLKNSLTDIATQPGKEALQEVISAETDDGLERFTQVPKEIKFKRDLVNNCYTSSSCTMICVFKTIQDKIYCAYSTKECGIVFYDLVEEKIAYTIENAHTKFLNMLRHYYDRKQKKDILLCTSADCSLSLWDINNNFKCILRITGAHKDEDGDLLSANLIFENKNNNIENIILSSSLAENIKLWTYKGKFIREIENSDGTIFSDIFYEGDDIYIIQTTSYQASSYDYKAGTKYKDYVLPSKCGHYCAFIMNTNGIITLVVSDRLGQIRLWDFHQGVLIRTIEHEINIYGICIWNDDYVFAGCKTNQLKLLDFKNGKLIKGYTSHTKAVLGVYKFVHPKYGECLVTNGFDAKIKLWAL